MLILADVVAELLPRPKRRDTGDRHPSGLCLRPKQALIPEAVPAESGGHLKAPAPALGVGERLDGGHELGVQGLYSLSSLFVGQPVGGPGGHVTAPNFSAGNRPCSATRLKTRTRL